jgi:hypothetical protein
MEMHSRQSLSEVHDISVLSRRQSRRRPIAGTAIARVLAFLKRMKTAIEAELACACRKSNPNILVVQPAQDRAAKNGPG